MKNSLQKILIIFFLNIFICVNANSLEQFNFDVTEIEILEKGNLIKGLKKGKITTDNNIFIDADSFTYNKITNILDANGNVEIFDNEKKIRIFSDNIRYLKNEERIITNGNSRAINNQGIIINAEVFDYKKKRKYIEC